MIITMYPLTVTMWAPTRLKGGWHLQATVVAKPLSYRINPEAPCVGFLRGAWSLQPIRHTVYRHCNGSTAEVTDQWEVNDEYIRRTP